MDAVLGYHLNPLTCGIAKFNQQLGDELGVPVVSIFSEDASTFQHPVLSLKTAEFEFGDLAKLEEWIDSYPDSKKLSLFLHAYSGTRLEDKLIERSEVVYVGNQELALELERYSDKLVTAWCPGTLLDRTPFHDVDISVMTFGMAHKMSPGYYHRLNDLLAATGKTYCLYVSTALHEGTTFEDDFLEVFQEMRDLFSGEVYFLGFLSDTVVYNYLRDTTYFAAFFPKGVRANNTSVNTAMECGATVITNLDEHSPEDFRHMHSMINIDEIDSLPTDHEVIESIGQNAVAVNEARSWARLIDRMRGPTGA